MCGGEDVGVCERGGGGGSGEGRVGMKKRSGSDLSVSSKSQGRGGEKEVVGVRGEGSNGGQWWRVGFRVIQAIYSNMAIGGEEWSVIIRQIWAIERSKVRARKLRTWVVERMKVRVKNGLNWIIQVVHAIGLRLYEPG